MAGALGARIMGFAPQRIEHIAVAEKAGVGPLSLEDVEMSRDWGKYRR